MPVVHRSGRVPLSKRSVVRIRTVLPQVLVEALGRETGLDRSSEKCAGRCGATGRWDGLWGVSWAGTWRHAQQSSSIVLRSCGRSCASPEVRHAFHKLSRLRFLCTIQGPRSRTSWLGPSARTRPRSSKVHGGVAAESHLAVPPERPRPGGPAPGLAAHLTRGQGLPAAPEQQPGP